MAQALKNNKNCNLTAHVFDINALSDQQKQDMFALYFQYYEATSAEKFLADLAGKDQVIVLYDRLNILRGFSSLKYIKQQFNGQDCQIIFSGDTIIHHHFWGEQSLAFCWLRRAGEIKAERPDIPLYYLLIVKGHRTYRLLQAFTCQYYPHWQTLTPPSIQAIMNTLGNTLFPHNYQVESGLIHFPVSQGQLRSQWAEPSPQAQSRPEVDFFLQKNPGFRQGDELLCFTELSSQNFRPLARRVFESGMK